jgi:hypothetical protein
MTFLKGHLVNKGRKRPDMLGNTFNVGRVAWNKGMKGYNAGPRTSIKVACKICKKEFYAQISCLKKGNQKCCGALCAKVLRNKENSDRSGVNHYRWIADRTKVKIGDRSFHDPLYKQWHRAVKARDGWRCKITDEKCRGRLEAHHILPWSKFPELRYKINNGITLCHHHHPRTRKDEMNLSPYFSSLVIEAKQLE